MKISDVPDAAFTATPTPVPTKVVPDWGAMYQILLVQGFVIIESDNLRTAGLGEASVPVRAFTNHVRVAKGKLLQTKRITGTRWFCCL